MPSSGKRCSRLSIARSTSSSESEYDQPPARSEIFFRWLPVVLWAACISWFSTDAFSARSTHNYIDPVLRFLLGPEVTRETLRLAHTIIRKMAHVTEYGVLAILLCRALGRPGTPLRPATVLRALIYCAAYASLDELHQTFVRSRAGSPTDVALDVGGASLGSLLLILKRGLGGTRG